MDLFSAESFKNTQPLTREAGLNQMRAFLPKAGAQYGKNRNFDKGRDKHDSVSCLSPYLRRRLITETELLQAVQARHRFIDCEKFIAEIFWRTYFKGWLEMRPDIWSDWLAYPVAPADHENFNRACQGKTNIACFNEWVDELQQTGYLHNHARMWFASIWIFTLKLPWQWGAGLFMHWLRDGDPASNTLSWRWVAGLHSRGKHYLARAQNIEQFTNGRFAPYGLIDEKALPLTENPLPPAIEPHWPTVRPEKPYILILHGEDCNSESWPIPAKPEAIAVLPGVLGNQSLGHGRTLRHALIDQLDDDALSDAGARAAKHFGCPVHKLSDEVGKENQISLSHSEMAKSLQSLAQEYQVSDLVMGYLPVGAWRKNLLEIETITQRAGLISHQITRTYDKMCWPHAKRGFFPFKENIPKWLAALGSA